MILGPDGKSVAGARVIGLTDSTTPVKLVSERVTMTGLHGDRTRAVVVLHEKRKLGAVAAVRGDSSKPFEVKLQPLGTLTGRLVDAEGKRDATLVPVMDATLKGPDAVFALLRTYVQRLEITQADQVLCIADGAPWIWKRVPLLVQA